MTLRTVTYDDSSHVLVPLEPTEKQLDAFDDWCQGRNLTMSWTTLAIVLKRLIAESPEYKEPENPLDTPLPCDIRIGAGTIKKGSKLSVIVHRMAVLYQMAMKNQLGIGEPANQEPTKDE